MREGEVQKAGNNIWFAWSGGTGPADKHYYRIQSPTFLVEFDETQDNANHIHSVWRDFNGDFRPGPARRALPVQPQVRQ
jgi:hypothetical protein